MTRGRRGASAMPLLARGARETDLVVRDGFVRSVTELRGMQGSAALRGGHGGPRGRLQWSVPRSRERL
jgi:hypothetical protein